MEIMIDWEIEDRNKEWHDKFFTAAALRDHQAKGSCPLVLKVIKYMEERGWLEKGDTILDPMCGIGSFLIVGAFCGYDGIGVELETTYYKDMVGWDTVAPPDDLFSFGGHAEGTIERFHNMTADMKNAGLIRIYQGDARNLEDVLKGVIQSDAAVCSPPYGNRLKDASQGVGSNAGRKGDKNRPELTELSKTEGFADQYSSNPENIGNAKIKVVTSPPYGNRLNNQGQTLGDGKFEDLQAERNEQEIYEAQYSDSKANIGNAKIKVVCSPPYSRSTEHSPAQIESLPKNIKDSGKSKGFQYLDPKNIAVLKDSPYRRQMQNVYNALYGVLSPGAVVALVTRNFIQKARVVMLDQLTIRLMERAGFKYMETIRARLPDISFFKRSNWLKHHKKKGLPLIDYEEITFYIKANHTENLNWQFTEGEV